MTERTGARELPKNFIAQAFRGFSYPLEAMRFISRHSLWGLCVVSIVINVVLLAGLIVASLYVLRPWVGQLESAVLGFSEAGWWQAVAGVLAGLLWLVVILLGVAVNAFVLLLVGQAVASPFLDLLSEKVESIVLQTDQYPFSIGRTIKSIVVAITDLFWAVLFLLAVNIPIWIVGMVPIVAPFAAVVSFCFNALVLALEFVGMPLTRHLVSYRTRWGLLWNNRWLGLGFGTAAMVLLLVPGLNLILLPLATVGGTLLYCDLKAAGRIDLSHTPAASAKPLPAP